MNLSQSDTYTVPHHVAIVMDGNGRWAKKRLMPRLAGHRQGVEALRRCVRLCMERGIRVLTVFAFSSENWQRPADEVSGLMKLMATALLREVQPLHEAGVAIRFVGDRTGITPGLLKNVMQGELKTAANTGLQLNVCFNYGGRWDMVQAAQAVVDAGLPLNEANLARHLATAHVADPDLLIRTGGETRISNFLLWQCAYSELYFSDCLWPDFDGPALDEALQDFAGRQRRFGKTSEQVQPD